MEPPEGLPSGGFVSVSGSVKLQKLETMCRSYPTDQRIHLLQEKVDSELAEEVRQAGCVFCGGRLHRADFDRKPRPGPAHWNERDSFCCAREGCRKRHTPPSVRFLGRKVYAGVVVILLAAMSHGLNPERLRRLRESLGVDPRTLQRWRQWWLESFTQSRFWKSARGRFPPGLEPERVPLSLCEAFEIERRDRRLDLLGFLSPLGAGAALQAGHV